MHMYVYYLHDKLVIWQTHIFTFIDFPKQKKATDIWIFMFLIFFLNI